MKVKLPLCCIGSIQQSVFEILVTLEAHQGPKDFPG